MATKPTVRIPLWASTGSKTDPGAGQEADGWDPGDRPPANWINWIYNAIGQWLGWAEDSVDEIGVEIDNLKERGIKAYGRVQVDGSGNVTFGSGSYNLLGGITSAAQIEVVINVPMVAGWVGLAENVSTGGIPDARILNVNNTGGANGSGGASTRSMIVYPFTHAGVAINPTNTAMNFEVLAIGSV